MDDSLSLTGFTTHVVGNPWKNWVFLVLHTAGGQHGVGEASLNGFALTTKTALEELQRYFLGRSALEISLIRNQMLNAVYSDGGQIHRSAVAAVEAACWDLLGKALDLPVYKLWGGAVREQIRLYANGWYRTERDPDAVAEAARAVSAMGYTSLKIDPFGPAYGDVLREERELSLRILRAVRDAVPSVQILLEGHCRFNVPTALELAKAAADEGVAWFEEPVPHWDRRGLAEVASRSPVRVATGENFTRFSDFVELATVSRNLVLQPDVANLGGLEEARRVCALGEALNLPVAPHDAQGPISKALCLQLAAWSPAVVIQEDFEPFNEPWTHGIAPPLVRKDGAAAIPDGPGLGRSVDLTAAAAHPYEEQAVLGLFEPGWELRRNAERSR